MKCSKCGREFEEKDIHESHDVPCYLFWEHKERRLRKQAADKYGRRYLCVECHEDYEDTLKKHLIECSVNFSKEWFDEDGDENGFFCG